MNLSQHEKAYLQTLSTPRQADYISKQKRNLMDARDRNEEEEEKYRNDLAEESKFPWEEFDNLLEKNEDAYELASILHRQHKSEKAFFDKRNGKTPLEFAKDYADEHPDHPTIDELIQFLETETPKGGRRRKSRRSRLNVQRRGTKRHGRSGKHRKLRKLATRRR